MAALGTGHPHKSNHNESLNFTHKSGLWKLGLPFPSPSSNEPVSQGSPAQGVRVPSPRPRAHPFIPAGGGP